MRRYFYFVFAFIFMAGCAQGPKKSFIEKQIASELSKHFGKDVFSIKTFNRKGHYPLEADKQRKQVLVYYSAEIVFEKDYRLSSWNKLNVGSLISVLGSTPLGVRGVKVEGNKKGDMLIVHGALAWKEKGESWQLTKLSLKKKKETRIGSDELLPYRRHLKRLQDIGATFQKNKKRNELKRFTEGLEQNVAASERRLSRSLGEIAIATGRSGGEYDRQGVILAKLINQEKRAKAFSSAGSAENCRLVAEGEVDFAYSQNDIAKAAYEGTGSFKDNSQKNLRALCSLYPEAIQIIVLKSGNIKSFYDLKGKKIDVGPIGSGMRINAFELLSHVGISNEDFVGMRSFGLPHSLEDLKAGRCDAAFITSAYPNASLEILANKHAIDVIDIPMDVQEKMIEKHPHLMKINIPAKTYEGLAQKSTLGVKAMLVTSRQVTDKSVTMLLQTLFANVEKLSRSSVQAYFIDKKHALEGIALKLHPAAKAFFKKNN